MHNRRKFLKQSLLATGALLTSQSILAEEPDVAKKLTILHTNDVHSRLEPFPKDDPKNPGLGGVEARAEVIKQIRAEEDHILLLDAGDIFQGTPYFNIYKGEPEIKAMAAMGYDAATMGNHDFDAGLENFATQLHHASFPIVVCNYDFTGTPMEFKYQPYKIFKKGKLKIGVTGVGIEGKGLIPDNLFGNTKYLDPIENASKIATMLKKEKSCDMVICLSHLGYKYVDNKISDIVLAKETENIDLILGGHTHTFMNAPDSYLNKNGNTVFVNQVGWAGIQLGRLDFEFSKSSKKNLAKSHTVVISKKTRE
ncbi:bifunctional metallophosphatase/5'-nucleotidase [Ferruginibacter sp. SUN002]|uniref:bifunctional metallophosphatase/5'-nucleotidase n=1 Tax=Ferruginibacter sp. SUN002 TaxID=2937789 RepID=UPI003D36315A